ncbi:MULTISPECIES: MarR family winged helix-turn-helix transcriptional regulator [unclassified Shewanella]|jgi:DNA-binding MarR family transcriptional regulator|uniref:MarR family winged helix-turn-helix transcriptional regulator n=1 Tax=unclassified Shewanella TaxID=196818 RepID=UPI00137BCD42|nr:MULTISPECIES: MarR family transcriptional regulator [unclassified Shewanella]MBB1363521.1 MarR family transcriptional regulator [Shewanella sp. SR44-4]MBO1896078.1 MarR family transcriptional regulator [Shewanella sp. BF02_Schw]QHS12408.1 MarR family transcriptional regulator [Shewanella sp. Arc9-LZ]|tara:strand:+ start:580 stop:1026 length:447 start_codon:yes stop_codon:yes gene_type:complete
MNKNKHLLLENQLCFAVYSTSLAITQLYKPLLDSIGLTYTQYLVMLVLWEQDGLSLKTLASKLGQQSGALTPVIKRLETDGLLKRIREPLDERTLCMQLTEKGHQLQPQAEQIHLCILEQCGIEMSEITDLKRQLDQFRLKLPSHIEF